MTAGELFIGSKKVKLAGKTPAKLEHLLQLARIEKTNYERACANYPPERMMRHAKPFLQRLDDNIAAIEAAIKDSA